MGVFDEYLINSEFVESGIIRGSTIIGNRIGIGEYSNNHYNFEVDSNGVLIANSGEFSGKLESAILDACTISNTYFNVSADGKLICTKGMIGSWTIDEDKIYASGLSLNSDGSITGSGFSISGNGDANFAGCNLYIEQSKTIVNKSNTTFNSLNQYVSDLITNNITISGALNASQARFDSLKVENYYYTNTVQSQFVYGGQLSVNYLNVISNNGLTSAIIDEVNAKTIYADYITTGTLSANRVNVGNATNYVSQFESAVTATYDNFYPTTIDCGSVYVSGHSIYAVPGVFPGYYVLAA